jgi:predicted GH43/DUF377 family glycosyl hydrolase
VALDVGPPGSADDLTVYDPSVVVLDGHYRMWYSGQNVSVGRPAIFLATSVDGENWTKEGLALPPGPPGSLDEIAFAASVRFADSSYVMVYTGHLVDRSRLFLAISTDGLRWEKRGLALDILLPEEGLIGFPNLLVAADRAWFVYYHARPSLSVSPGLQIYLATHT